MNSVKLAVVQFTPVFGDKDENFRRIRWITDSIDADIIVMPELCTTGYFFLSKDEVLEVAETPSGPTVNLFREIAKNHGAIVIAGYAERAENAVYNSCMIVVPETDEVSIYRKTHLFYKEIYCFDPGNTGFFVLRNPKRQISIGPMICYDWRFPEVSRIFALLGADLIVCPSNLITDAWKIVMPARAIENKVYLAVANRSGSEERNGEKLVFKANSAIYGYNGQSLAEAGDSGDKVICAEIWPEKTRDKSFNPLNDILKDRKPEYYQALVEKG